MALNFFGCYHLVALFQKKISFQRSQRVKKRSLPNFQLYATFISGFRFFSTTIFGPCTTSLLTDYKILDVEFDQNC
jgi:hypothetical protein